MLGRERSSRRQVSKSSGFEGDDGMCLNVRRNSTLGRSGERVVVPEIGDSGKGGDVAGPGCVSTHTKRGAGTKSVGTSDRDQGDLPSPMDARAFSSIL